MALLAAPLQHLAHRIGMGHLLLFAFGSGLLAREVSRHFRARLKEEAQRLTVQEVTATVSHDLKNPLNAIAGLIEMLLESAPETMPFEQRALLHRIDANAQQMVCLYCSHAMPVAQSEGQRAIVEYDL